MTDTTIEKIDDTTFAEVSEVKETHTVEEVKADIALHEAEIQTREENKANTIASEDAAIATAQAEIASDEKLLDDAKDAGVITDPVEPTPEPANE